MPAASGTVPPAAVAIVALKGARRKSVETLVVVVKGDPELLQVVDEQGRPVMPLLILNWFEVEGPLTTEADRAKRQGVIPANADDPQEVQACLRRFAEWAWRRPVSAAEIEPYVRFIAAEQEVGVESDSAYKSTLSSMLISRRFFNLEEGFPDENRKQVNDFELASRLSYFLWG